MNVVRYFCFSLFSLCLLWRTQGQEAYQNPGWQTANGLNQQELQNLVQGWQNTPPNPNTNTTLNASAFLSGSPLEVTQVSASLAATSQPSLPNLSSASLAAAVGNEADTITPEIQALAIALDKDPVKIFEYLHNTIDYELYYGCKKGAHLTLLEGGGNDMDQAALHVALLRSSGIAAQYRHGATLFPYSFLTSWWGMNSIPYSYMTDSQFATFVGLTNPTPSEILHKRRSICAFEAARTAGFFMCEPFRDASGSTWISIPLTRVVFTYGGSIYTISPAVKSYTSPSAVNLPTTFGYNRTNFLSSAGGTSALPDSIQNLNESNISNTLSNYTSALITSLRNTHDSKSIDSLLGKRKIITRSFTSLQDAIPIVDDTAATWYSANTLSAIPNDRMAKIAITAGTYNYATKTFSSTLYSQEVTTPSLSGKKLSLAFAGNTASVRLGEALLSSTFTLSASSCDIRIKVSHGFYFLKYQGSSWVSDPANLNRYNSEHVTKYGKSNSNAYAFSYSFSDPAQQLRVSQERLDGYTRAGITDWRATTEMLNINGLRYFKQLFDATQCLETLYQVRTQNHNLVATVAQEASYYIDIGVFTSSDTQIDANQGISDAFYGLRSMFGSSMEHGVFEQSQRTNSGAVSTVRLLQAANQLGQKIYRATSANKTQILNALTNYSTNKKTEISNLLTLSNEKALLPQNGKFKLGTWDWEGGGYAAEQSDKVHMIISKTLNLNGGYSTYNNNTYSISQAQQNLNSSPSYNQGVATGLNALTYVPNSTPKHISWDPVELSSGAFILAKTDLSLGNASAPLGITFSRDYHTHKRYDHSAGLGYGWSHSASAYITERSAPEAAFGGADIYQAAPFFVAAAVAKDLHGNHTNAKEWLTAALVVHWAMEQVRYNAVSVTIGNQALQFIKMPDGTFIGPPGQKMTLTRNPANIYTLQERHGNTYQFDANNRLASIVDPSGNTISYNYDAVSGKISSIVDAFSRSLTFNWTGNQISSISDSTGRTISYQYTNGDLTSFTDPEGKIHTYQYDAEHRIDTMKDPENRFLVKNFYDAQSRVTRQLSMNDPAREWTYTYSGYVNKEKNPQGGITTYYHDARGRNIGSGNALGHSHLIRYDGQDRLITTVTRNNELTDNFYNSDHNLVAQYDPLSHYDEYFYDSQKRLERINDKSGKDTLYTYTANHLVETITTETGYRTPSNLNDHVTRHTYWPNGLLKTSKDPEGKITTYEYDSWGQVNKIIYHDSKFITKLHNARGDLLESTDENGNKTIFTYNKRRQLLTTTLPSVPGKPAAVITNEYDDSGNLFRITDAKGHQTTFTYNALGDNLTTTHAALPAGNNVITHSYDSRNWPITTTNSLGQISTTYYDAAKRITSVKDPLHRITDFEYNKNDQTTLTKDPLLRESKQDYTERGEAKTATDALTKTSTNTYYNNGTHKTFVNRRGKTYTKTYTGENLLHTLTTPTGKVTTHTYYMNGLPKTIQEPSGQTTTLTYNARNLTEIKSDAVATTSYTYHNNTLPHTTSEGTNQITRTYDQRNRLKSYTNDQGETILYDYDSNNNLTTLTYPPDAAHPSGKTVTYTYNARNLLATVTDWNNRVTSYHYDRLGRLTGITRPNGTSATMAYDAADQRTSIKESANGKLISYLSFDYDAAGQVKKRFRAPLVQSSWQHPSFSATYDDDNRLASVSGQTVFHDADGNMTYGPIRPNAGFTGLTYNARNQLTQADGFTYTYDAEGHRRTITNSTGTTRYTTDPNAELSRHLIQHRPDGSKTYYVYGLGLLYEVNQAEQTKTYHYDQVGSTILRTNDSGNVIGKAEYSAYGICFWKQGDMDTPFQYNGQAGIQTDSNGLLHMRARYYSPYLMRFLNADPIGFSGGSNWFAYADGNPISMSDPFGLWSWNQTWGGIKAVGGIAEAAVGVTVGAATSWTGIGAVAGVAVVAHGVDTFQSGLRQAFTGQETDSLTSKGLQQTGISRNAANLVDAGIGIVAGGAGLLSGANKTAAIMKSSEAAGMSTMQALLAWERGSVALNGMDYAALGQHTTSALQKAAQLEAGFNTSTSALQNLGQSIRLAPTGLTPLGDFLMGAASTAASGSRMLK